MSVIDNIIRQVRSLPLREQVEVARYVHRLSVQTGNERDRRTHGALDEADGLAFEEAMNERPLLENHG